MRPHCAPPKCVAVKSSDRRGRSRERDFSPHVFQKTGLHWIFKSDCLFNFVFFPVLTCSYLFCAENCSEHQNKTIFGAKQVKSGKNWEKTQK